MKKEYRITGRFRKDSTRHTVDRNAKWTKADAERRLKEIEAQSKWEMEHKAVKPTQCGMFSIDTPYYSEYDLLELRIESREVSDWTEE